jgi:hypothetical protein
MIGEKTLKPGMMGAIYHPACCLSVNFTES